MSLGELLKAAPGQRTYSKLVLDAVASGAARPEWTSITIRRAGHVAVLDVLAVPLQLDDGEGGRVTPMFSATLQQLVLDQIGGLLPTVLVMDEMWRSAGVRVPPLLRNWYLDNSLGTPEHMMEQSDAIMALLSRLPPGIVALPWKSWVLDARFKNRGMKLDVEQAFNHGLYLDPSSGQGRLTPGGCRVIEQDDGGHDRLWGDYSQVGLGMRGIVIVDGVVYATVDVLRDPELSKVLTYDGPLSITRQPGTYDVHSFDAR